MNYSFIPLLNAFKTAIGRKKTKLFVKFSQQNILFAEFLQQKKLIAGFTTQKQYKKKTLVLFIKYDNKKVSAITEFSIASKVAYPRPNQKLPNSNKEVNFIINVTSKQGSYGQLMARIR